MTLERQVEPEPRETAERVHGFLAGACPLHRTLGSAISTELVLVSG